MKRSERKESCSGYLTVYLSLILAVLLSLFLALLEGVGSNAVRVEAECVTEIGLNSILAEYHQELFSQYNLFAIDSSYGTRNTGVEDMTGHLLKYLDRNLSMDDIFLGEYLYRDFLGMSVDSVELTGRTILTDGNGAVFRQRAVEAMKDDCNLTILRDLQQWMQVMEDNDLRNRDISTEKSATDAQIQAYDGREIQISEEEWTTIHIENPTTGLEQIRNSGILKYVVEDVELLSEKMLSTEHLVVSRMAGNQMNKGNMAIEDSTSNQLEERFFFQEYLLRYLGHYGAEREESALSYQVEYLLGNNDTDVANLKEVVNIICAIREAANTLYLFSDAEKCAEAEGLATLVATICLVPEIAQLLKVTLLMGWAYAESLYDVEVLLAGGRIPLMKDRSDWHYDLESALSFRECAATETSKGLGYEDYLRILLMFVDLDTLTGRAMNMVEADIRQTRGNSSFRLDNCFEQVEFHIHFKSVYGYECEITRKKRYL